MPHWSYSGRIELVVWSIPILVIAFLGGIAWIGSYQLNPFSPVPSAAKPLEVQVVSLDWKWLFIYPDENIAAVNELVIPVGVPVHFALTSASVMNAFFVPQLGTMIYTMPGMSTQLNLRADHPGNFYGRSAHFSGDGFPEMQFTVHAVSPEAFDTWARATASAGSALNDERYRRLEVQSTVEQPFTFGSITSDLYGAIVSQKLPPGPGPAAKSSGREKARQEPIHAG